ncbi:putative non-canonical poly(A) polymerase [Clavispora lusitaniae]|nr:putative non-canonical poly(A) polymerase [Clavispora lusitaniae]
MGQKRSNDSQPAVTRKKARKTKKKPQNTFETLPPEPQDDIVLVESGDESHSDVVVFSDREEETQETETKEAKAIDSIPETADAAPPNDLTNNNDYIRLGLSSSEDEAEDLSDDGVLSDDESGSRHHSQSATSPYPWVKGHDHSKQREIADWLTMEIKDFVNYISPSKEEIVVRNTVIRRLKRRIAEFWPQTQAHVFGSCATDLYLPGSDIDMVVISTTGDYEQRGKLYQLSSFLRTNKLAKNIEVIATAKVPIIKFVDPQYNIHVDISFERTNGLDAARRIRKWLDSMPGLRELVLIVKQFLRSRRLNNVHVGGLGGYATIILMYHFLRLHPRVSTGNISVMENLGTLLIEFFELYGRNFSYDHLIVALANGEDPRYLLKSRNHVLTAGRGQFSIVVQDPSDPANNITRSSYNLRDLKKAFGGAYQLLVEKCYELHAASYKNRIGQSILGDIIKYRGKDRDFNDDRDKVVNSALISHLDDEDDDESDGADGNDKYYLSDMTSEEEETYVAPEHKQPQKNENKASVESFMGIQSESEEEEKVRTNLDKDVKREYWRSKGLEI